MPPALIIAFFLTLALIALWASWHDEDLRWIGMALVGSSMTADACWALGVGGQTRSSAYTMVEVVIAFLAFVAWQRMGSRALIAIVAITVLSITVNIGFSAIPIPNDGQKYAHALICNIFFAFECVMLAWAGMADAIRVGRFGWRYNRGWRFVFSHDLRKELEGVDRP